MDLRIAQSAAHVTIGSFRDFYAFEQHVSTCRAKRGLEMVPQWYEQPVFYFSNHRSIVGDGAEVFAPLGCNELDFELEIGVVIGKAGRDIAEADAWDHVLGFTIVNDLSARDLQRAEMKVGLGPSKGKDFATAVGPEVVPLKALRDAINSDGRVSLAMSCDVNGKRLSQGNAADMHFTWPQIIAHASRDTELRPGDLLGSGTVGTGCILELGPDNTGGWLKPGDGVTMQIERLGTLTTRIVERAAQGNQPNESAPAQAPADEG
ncbi:fumarylacetoacetate hydrolase family protein [Phycisphaeraceae bacterium D3-23]